MIKNEYKTKHPFYRSKHELQGKDTINISDVNLKAVPVSN